ncbi:hypothetical protein AX16_002952 [Volvariella volvacea WC 439]|nr:hypothetical protein AX16_002952 [Volvariella volvacea WC 439]
MLVTLVNLSATNLVCVCHGATINQSLQSSHSLATTGTLPSEEQRKEAQEHKHPEAVYLTASSGATAEWSKARRKLTLRTVVEDDEGSKGSEEFAIRLHFGLRPWKAQTVPPNCPYRIYSHKISKDHYNVIILQKRDMASFLSELPDTLPLSSLLLPGTHETMALHGWPFSQCQSSSSTLDVQLRSGIRFIDVRLSIIKEKLISYHGIYPQRTPFSEILTILHTFLTSPSSASETVIMSIKQEDFRTNSWLDFSRLVLKEIKESPGGLGLWFLENRVPRLEEVRGKVVMFSRFGGNGDGWVGGTEGMGIHPYRWPDSAKAGFTWDLKGTIVRTHDWYEIPSFLAIPEKFTLASSILLPPVNDPPAPTLSISFFSASSFPLALPPVVAQGFGFPNLGFGVEGINSRFGKWLLDLFSGVLGADGKSAGGSGSGSGSGGDSASRTTVNPSDDRIVGVDSDEKRRRGERPGERARGVDEPFVAPNPKIRGWALLDYFDEPEELVPLLVECNFKG